MRNRLRPSKIWSAVFVRVQIQPDDVANLLDEQRIGDEFYYVANSDNCFYAAIQLRPSTHW